MKIQNLVSVGIFLLLVEIVFHFIFLPVSIGGGDYTPASLAVQILNGNFFGWCGYRDLGFNCIAINLHYSFFWVIIHSVSTFIHLPTALSDRIFWWIPFFILSFISTALLVKKVFPQARFWVFAPILYTFNTYLLMLLGGGQVSGIGLGYASIPLLLLVCTNLLEKQNFFWSFLFGFSLAMLVAIDPRMGYIGASICVAYAVISFFYNWAFTAISIKSIFRAFFFLGFIPGLIAIGLHFYWILPAVVFHENPLHDLGPAYDTVGAVKFFSFATFENALSLLHPNWPENIFGLTHFMRPEFLLLPFLLFSSLLFLPKKRKESLYIIFFLSLSLVGAFLAKGANEPFGGFYLWMFEKIPGFSLFRDSTKWYLFVALGYSIILPFFVDRLYSFFGSGKKFSIFNFSFDPELKTEGQFLNKSKIFNVQNFFLVCVFLYLLILIAPALQNKLSGTFRSHAVPQEYIDYQKFLDSDKSFSRTFWIPQSSRFGQFDIYHPTIDSGNMLNASESGILSFFQKPDSEKILQEASVNYVVVPDDVDHEIFITDRKYDEKQYQAAITALKQIPWLTQKKSIGRIIIFSVPYPKTHFWLEGENGSIISKQINPTTYTVFVKNVQKGQRLFFSENFNSDWIASINAQHIQPQRYDNYFITYSLPRSGSYTITVRFVPQDYVEKGLWVSGSVLLLLIGYFGWFVVRNLLK